MLLAGTVMDIPLPGAPLEEASAPTYLIVFDNGSQAAIPLDQMASLIPPPPVNVGSLDSSDSLLPPFLRLNSKITYEHDGQYHKGFLGKRDGCYRFVFKSHVNKRKEDWSVPLPNLVSSWVDMCVEGILLPGHVSHTFIRTSVTTMPTTFDPVASFVSALNLHRECPPTLLRALADSHPDREVWLDSFAKRKRAFNHLRHTRKSLSESIARCARRALLKRFQRCAFSPSNGTRTFFLTALNRESWFWGITKIESGLNRRSSLRSFVVNPFGS
jgi:hypothetical protein